MKALVFTDLSTVRYQTDVPDPEPGEGEVLITVAACGICGSDLHGITHPSIRVPPLVMGHELAGTTSDGRRVTVNPLIACGTCDLCLRGRPVVCRNRRIVGIHRGGGYAEKVAVPQAQVHDLPAEMPFLQASLIEPLANAVHAWRLATALEVPERIGVLGAGTIGLVSLLVAQAMGVPDVSVADLSPQRRDTAAKLGAASVGAALDREFDLIIDAVGAGPTRRASLDRLRPGGTALWLGLLEEETPVHGVDLIRGEKRIVGSFCYDNDDFAQAVTLAGTVDHSWLTAVPLAESEEVFTALMHGSTDITKAVLVP